MDSNYYKNDILRDTKQYVKPNSCAVKCLDYYSAEKFRWFDQNNSSRLINIQWWFILQSIVKEYKDRFDCRKFRIYLEYGSVKLEVRLFVLFAIKYHLERQLRQSKSS